MIFKKVTFSNFGSTLDQMVNTRQNIGAKTIECAAACNLRNKLELQCNVFYFPNWNECTTGFLPLKVIYEQQKDIEAGTEKNQIVHVDAVTIPD